MAQWNIPSRKFTAEYTITSYTKNHQRNYAITYNGTHIFILVAYNGQLLMRNADSATSQKIADINTLPITVNLSFDLKQGSVATEYSGNKTQLNITPFTDIANATFAQYYESTSGSITDSVVITPTITSICIDENNAVWGCKA